MTFAIIRRGVIADHAAVDTFDALVAWFSPRRRRGDVLAILGDEGLRVGGRVDVVTVRVGLASRPAVESAALH